MTSNFTPIAPKSADKARTVSAFPTPSLRRITYQMSYFCLLCFRGSTLRYRESIADSPRSVRAFRRPQVLLSTSNRGSR